MEKVSSLFGKNLIPPDNIHSPSLNNKVLLSFATTMVTNNLENIRFDEVNNNGVPYAVFRNTLRPKYATVIGDIFKGYFFLAIIITAAILLFHYSLFWTWLIIPLSAIAIGYIAAYLALFIHEAGHFNIHPNKKMNDRLAFVFLCLPFCLSIKSYRKIHWQHHVHLGHPADAETSYFNAPTPLFIIETFTGIHLLRTVLKKKNSTVLTSEQSRTSRLILIAGLFLHGCILAAFFLTGNWPIAISWIAGFGIFFPFFATLRQILEHRDELASRQTDFTRQSHGKISRIFMHHFLSSSFGSAGFTRHMIHHWDPLISYTRLKDIENFLLGDEHTAAIIKNSKTSYTTALKKLVAAS